MKKLALALVSAFVALSGTVTGSVLTNIPAAYADEPVHSICHTSNGYEVRIVGHLGDLIEIHQNGRRIFSDYNQMRQSMGGNSGYLSCKDIQGYGNVIAVRVGWKHDLVHAYGLIRDAHGDIIGTQRAIIRLRDGSDIGVRVINDDVLVQFGRESDLRTRLCFGPRSGADQPPYGAGEWGWFYGTPRTGDFPGCMGRLNTGGSGSANWGQDHFTVGDMG